MGLILHTEKKISIPKTLRRTDLMYRSENMDANQKPKRLPAGCTRGHLWTLFQNGPSGTFPHTCRQTAESTFPIRAHRLDPDGSRIPASRLVLRLSGAMSVHRRSCPGPSVLDRSRIKSAVNSMYGVQNILPTLTKIGLLPKWC